MEELLREFLPHAPQLGLYLAPDIPDTKLRAALSSFGEVLKEAPLALYDATRFGTGRSGALFGPAHFCFQNLIEAPQRVAYTDLIRIEPKKSLLGGRRLVLTINRARATFEHELDFSARADALPYIERFLKRALAVSSDAEAAALSGEQDDDVERAVQTLEMQQASLTDAQVARLRRLVGAA